MKVEYNDVIGSDELKDGDLAVIVECPYDTGEVGRVAHVVDDIFVVLGGDHYELDSRIKVRRIYSVRAVEPEPEKVLASDMKFDQVGVIVDGPNDYSSFVGLLVVRTHSTVQEPEAAIFVVPGGERLDAANYVVRILPPGSKIIL